MGKKHKIILLTYWFRALDRYFTKGFVIAIITVIIIPLAVVIPTPHVNAILKSIIIIGLIV